MYSAEMAPLVSVIMPTWNRASLIQESVQSVIDQTYQHWELIIVDDGSTDNTREVIGKIADERIRYVPINHTGVIVHARKAGLPHATGELVAFHDSDDLWLPEKLAIQLNHLNRHPDAAFIFSNGYHFGDQTEPPASLESLFVGNIFLPMLLEQRFILFVPSLLMKKEVFAKTTFGTFDLAFFLNMAFSFQGIFTNDRLVRIRKHPISQTATDPSWGYHHYLLMLEDFRSREMVSEEQYDKIKQRELYKLGCSYMQQRRLDDALNAFKELRKDHAHWLSWIKSLQTYLLKIIVPTGEKSA